ncbi:MAG: PadR family transcriptional regulator [Cyanophyceae cyanobacterium]
MALAQAILSVLVTYPSSGYDLTKRFDNSVEGSVGFFWNAKPQQIYRELSRLEDKGWLESETVRQENRPDKKIYSVTALGKQQFSEWIADSEDATPIKDDLLVKLFAGYLVPRQVILDKLEAHRLQHQQTLAIYREIEQNYFSKPQQLSAELKFNYATLLRGIHYELGWLSWCEQVVPLLQPPSVENRDDPQRES